MLNTLPFMAKEKKTDTKTDTMRIDKALLKKLRHLANHNDMALSEFVGALLDPIVGEQYPKMIEEEMAGIKRAKPKRE